MKLRAYSKFSKFAASCFALIALSSAPALADGNDNGARNKSEAAKKAQKKVNGRVLKVDQSKSKYRVKVLQKSGRVVSVDVDKKSGKVSKQKVKD